MTLRLVDEVDFGGKYVEAQVHDTGKFHEILGPTNFLASVLDYLDGPLADTMHKFESYSTSFELEIAESVKWNKQEQRHKSTTTKSPKNTRVLNVSKQ